MAELLTAHVDRQPDEVALADASGRTTWGELNRRINRWIHALRGAGLQHGDRVAVLSGNRREVFEATVACLHAGFTLVPINWHLTPGEIAYILADSGSRALLVDPQRAPAGAQAIAETAGDLALLAVLGDTPMAGFAALETVLAQVSDAEPDGQCSGSALLYTSGTSGRPKGAVNALFRLGAPMTALTGLLTQLAGLGVPDRGKDLLIGPWYHSGQLFFSLFPLLRGCPLVVRHGFDPAGVLELIDEEQITHCHLVPIHFVRMLRLDAAQRAAFRGDSLHLVWHGAAPTPVEVKQQMIDWWGPVFVEYYAATEGGVATMIDSAGWLKHPGSVGRAAPPTEIVIAGPDGSPLPAHTDGLVYLRRPPERGFHYHNAPEKTRQAYLDDRTFTFGDVGHLDDDGYLYLTGRDSDMIISGGVNVYPVEVENALLTHPAVRDVAVFGVSDDEYGERVAAAVVLEPDQVATESGDLLSVLDRHCRENLAGFKVPRHYQIVAELPREPSGKLRKHLVRATFSPTAAPPPAGRDSHPAAAGLAEPARYGDGVPHAEFARLRREAPVSWVAEPVRRLQHDGTSSVHRGPGFWAVTRYESVVAVSRAPALFSAAEGGVFLADPRTPDDLVRARQMLSNMDAPRHTATRRLVTPAFSPSALEALREQVLRHAEAVTARVVEAEQFDAVRDLAAELPLLVLADLLGIPHADRELLLRWSNHLVGFDDPEYGGGDVDAYRQTFAEARQYLAELTDRRRRDPGDDLLSRLLQSEVDGRRLTEGELLAFWMLLVAAGNETTRHLISGGLEALTQFPAERDRLVSNPELVSTAAEELLRWVTPIMQFRRTATADTELDGQQIRAGDKVVVYYISANFDDQVFAEPDRLDVGRTPNPHLAFGTGPHVCLGARLAHLEFQTLLRCLLPYLSRLELVGEPVRLKSNFMNGIKSMPARFHR